MKKSVIMLFFICAGIVLGTFVGYVSKDVSFLSWLSYGMNFGMTSPLHLDLGVMTFTIGMTFSLNIAVIIFVSGMTFLGLRFISKRK